MPRVISAKSIHTNLPVIAIVGRPNVGKSSLFNALIGRRLSIVHEASGVTRDRVAAPLVAEKCRFELIDTGGLGTVKGEQKGSDEWDDRIAVQVQAALDGAQVLIFVVNVQDGITALDEEVARYLHASNLPVVLAVNKCDNQAAADEALEFCKLGFGEVLPVSCTQTLGLKALLHAAIGKLPDYLLMPEELVDEKAFSIAVVGRPNVGKSSLVNTLLGEERVIVSPVAGTTRDSIDVDFQIECEDGSRRAVLIDTAGLRRRGKVDNVVEYFSAMRVESAIQRADLVLLVVEADVDGVTAQDKKIAALVESSGKACIIVANKHDLCREEAMKSLTAELRNTLYNMDYAPVVFISAMEKRNIGRLLDKIVETADQVSARIPTAVVNRFILDVTTRNTPPVVGNAPLKIYYASMVSVTPPKFLIFVNEPKYCAPHYLTFLRNKLREAFDFAGLPIVIELRARPKSVSSFHAESGAKYKGTPEKTAPKTLSTAKKYRPTAATRRNKKRPNR